MNDLATQELNQLEKIIEKNLTAFYEVGRALIRIRDGQLYKGEYGTFEEYCNKRWDFSKVHAYRLIEATQTLDTLKSNPGVTPQHEKHVRPLTKLDPPQQKEAWQRAVETAPEGKVTAAHVQAVVDEMTGKAKVYKLHREPPPADIDPAFKAAFDGMVREIKNARALKWRTVSKENAIKYVQALLDIVTI